MVFLACECLFRTLSNKVLPYIPPLYPHRCLNAHWCCERKVLLRNPSTSISGSARLYLSLGEASAPFGPVVLVHCHSKDQCIPTTYLPNSFLTLCKRYRFGQRREERASGAAGANWCNWLC